jgi:hypothetical protein
VEDDAAARPVVGGSAAAVGSLGGSTRRLSAASAASSSVVSGLTGSSGRRFAGMGDHRLMFVDTTPLLHVGRNLAKLRESMLRGDVVDADALARASADVARQRGEVCAPPQCTHARTR